MKALEKLVTREIERQGLTLREWTADGRAVLQHGDGELTVSLDNLSRNIERDGHQAEAIRAFVSGIKATFQPLPSWPDAAAGLRFQLENSELELGDTLSREVSRCVYKF